MSKFERFEQIRQSNLRRHNLSEAEDLILGAFDLTSDRKVLSMHDFHFPLGGARMADTIQSLKTKGILRLDTNPYDDEREYSLTPSGVRLWHERYREETFPGVEGD